MGEKNSQSGKGFLDTLKGLVYEQDPSTEGDTSSGVPSVPVSGMQTPLSTQHSVSSLGAPNAENVAKLRGAVFEVDSRYRQLRMSADVLREEIPSETSRLRAAIKLTKFDPQAVIMDLRNVHGGKLRAQEEIFKHGMAQAHEEQIKGRQDQLDGRLRSKEEKAAMIARLQRELAEDDSAISTLRREVSDAEASLQRSEIEFAGAVKVVQTEIDQAIQLVSNLQPK